MPKEKPSSSKKKKEKKEKKEKKDKTAGRSRSNSKVRIEDPEAAGDGAAEERQRTCTCCGGTAAEDRPLLDDQGAPDEGESSAWQTMKTRRMVPVWLFASLALCLFIGASIGGTWLVIHLEKETDDSGSGGDVPFDPDCEVAENCARTPKEFAEMFVSGQTPNSSSPCVAPNLMGAVVTEDVFGKDPDNWEPTALMYPDPQWGRRIVPAFGADTLRKLLMLGTFSAAVLASELPTTSAAELRQCAHGQCALRIVVWQANCSAARGIEDHCAPLARWRALPNFLTCIYGLEAPVINATEMERLETLSFAELTGCQKLHELGVGPTWTLADIMSAQCSTDTVTIAEYFQTQKCITKSPYYVKDTTYCPAETRLLHYGLLSALHIRIFLLLNNAIGPDFNDMGFVTGPTGALVAEQYWVPNALVQNLPHVALAHFYNGTPAPPTPAPTVPSACTTVLKGSGCLRGGGNQCAACIDSVWDDVQDSCTGYPQYDWCLPLEAGCLAALNAAGCAAGGGYNCATRVSSSWSTLADVCGGWEQKDAVTQTRCWSTDTSDTSPCGQTLRATCLNQAGCGSACESCVDSNFVAITGKGTCQASKDVLEQRFCSTVDTACRTALLNARCTPGKKDKCCQCVVSSWDTLSKPGGCAVGSTETVQLSYCGCSNSTVRLHERQGSFTSGANVRS